MPAVCRRCMVVPNGDMAATVFLCDEHQGRSVVVPTQPRSTLEGA